MKQKSMIPAVLRQRRNAVGLSVKDVVTKLKERGISISEKTLSGYENGVGTPKVNTFLCLCDIYKIANVMDAFGYSSRRCISVHPLSDQDDWEIDMYNDFFNLPLLDKFFMVLREGIPSFSGYMDRLEEELPTASEAANFNKLYNLFMQLTEFGQGVALSDMERLARNPDYAIPKDVSRREWKEDERLQAIMSKPAAEMTNEEISFVTNALSRRMTDSKKAEENQSSPSASGSVTA